MNRLSDVDWSTWRARHPATLVFVFRGEEILLIDKKTGLGKGKINGPGGKVDPGETPEQAASRELREETGYAAGRVESLGSINPNPALFANRVHMWAALDCVPVGPIQNSSNEETSVELLPLARLGQSVREGAIDHALVVAALYSFELWRSSPTR